MKLYMVPLAPNPVKVMLYIAERTALGLDMGIEQVIVNTLKGRHREPEHLARNPFGTLPVLQLDDSTHIRESRVIIDYLEDIFPDHRLFSDNPVQRAMERDLERICDVRLAEHLGVWVHVYKSPIGLPPDPERAAYLEDRMQPALDYLDSLLADGRPFICGDSASVADCTLQAFLQFVRFTKADLLGDRPHLRRWDDTYKARPHIASLVTP